MAQTRTVRLQRAAATRWLPPERVVMRVTRQTSRYLVLVAPDGQEVWVDRSEGTTTGAKGGAGGGSESTVWAGWRLEWADWSAVYVEAGDGD